MIGKRSKIAAKVLGPVIMIVAVAVITNIISSQCLTSLNSFSKTLTQNYVPQLEVMGELQAEFQELQKHMCRMLISTSAEEGIALDAQRTEILADIDADLETYHGTLANLDASVQPVAEQGYQQIVALYQNLSAKYAESIEFMAVGDMAGAAAYCKENVFPVGEQLREAIDAASNALTEDVATMEVKRATIYTTFA